MEELYFVRRKRGNYKTLRLEFGEVKNKFLLRFIEGEINPELKSESYTVETFYDDEQEMLKKVLKLREQLSEERWMLKTRGQNRNMSIEQ
jgi:hypothetical protein